MLTTSKNTTYGTSSPTQNAKGSISSTNNEQVAESLERTLGLITCNDNLEDTINHIKNQGFTIVNTKTTHFTLEQAQEFYADHKTQNYYDKMVNWLSGGLNIYALVLEKENAVKDWKYLMGPANYKKARKVNPNSIRALFGKDASQNATHGSDSDASAKKEIEFVFGDNLANATYEPSPNAQKNAIDMQKESENSTFENGQVNDAIHTEKVMKQEENGQVAPPAIEEKQDAALPVVEELSTKSSDINNVDSSDTVITPTYDEIGSSIKGATIESQHNTEQAQHKTDNEAPTFSNDSANVTSKQLESDERNQVEPISDNAAQNNNKVESETDKVDSVGKVEEVKNKFETPNETNESTSEQAEDIQIKKTSNSNEENAGIILNESDEKSDNFEREAEINPIENAVPSDQDLDKIESTAEMDEVVDEKLESGTAEKLKEDSVTATPSSERSVNNFSATNSTDVEIDKEEEIKANDIAEDTKEESTPEKQDVTVGESKKEEIESKPQLKTNNAEIKANPHKKTSITNKEITASASRIRPPSSINKTQNIVRNSAPTTTSAARQISINNNKSGLTSGKTGTTRIARLSPSATLNKDNEKKKPVSATTRDSGVPSVAKKAVTKVSRNLPRVALMASQKPAKNTEKNDEEDVEKKPKKRTSSTRSFISRLTAPTVASANKKTEADTPAVASITNTPKRSSLPSKRSSTVRPIVSSSKDAPLRNKQKKEADNNDKQERIAAGLTSITHTENTNERTQHQQEQLST